MSIQSDIVSALSAVAGGQVYPQAAPQDVAPPFVVYRRVGVDPTTLLSGVVVCTESAFDFVCHATTMAAALTLADAVRAALNGAGTLSGVEQTSAGDEYEPLIDAYVEAVRFTFWH